MPARLGQRAIAVAGPDRIALGGSQWAAARANPVPEALTQPRRRAAASLSASSSATGVRPNSSVVALESSTNGRVNW